MERRVTSPLANEIRLHARILDSVLAPAAGAWLNHDLNRPTRAFADLVRQSNVQSVS
jgi:hypothetical protein